MRRGALSDHKDLMRDEKIRDGKPIEVVSDPLVIDIYVGGAAALG